MDPTLLITFLAIPFKLRINMVITFYFCDDVICIELYYMFDLKIPSSEVHSDVDMINRTTAID